MEDTEFRIVLEHITDGVLLIDNEGRIRLCNRALANMFSIDRNLRDVQIFSLPRDYQLRQGIFRVDRNFQGPYCWEGKKCVETIDCPERGSTCCRCWIFSLYGSIHEEGLCCYECPQYRRVKRFLEKPKELEIGDKTISVLSTFIEYCDKAEIWEIIVFRDATFEKLDAVVKLAGAAAHELRQPLQAILSSTIFLRRELGETKQTETCLDVIDKSCLRMDRIIKNIGQITQYRTKRYTETKRILDIEESSSDSGDR